MENAPKKERRFSAIIEKEEDWYVSLCPELDVASQGRSVEEALKNLREAVELYLEDEDVRYKLRTVPLLEES
ncbi:MAG: type II toxin-antitoxin system HicB family antitoxin [Candidatus Micrarchaeota archaeon]